MHRGDVGGSSYDPQYYPPHYQNPNLISAPTDPQYAHATAPYASAPPVSSGYASSDYSSYPSNYPPYPQNSDHVPSQPPPYSNTFPHLEAQQPGAYYTYDQNQNQNQSGLSYDYLAAGANYNPPNPNYSSASFSSAPHLSSSYGSSGGSNFGNSVESNVNYSGYADQGLYDSGVYKYNGGKADTYGGSGGSRSEPSSEVLFDDYGRPINIPGGKEQKGSGSFPKIVKAVPKVEEHEDPKGGVLKFRVKLLSEGYGQTDMDVLCQIGLDGIRILEPATSRTLKIYPLDDVARWEVLDSYIFAFWTKSSVDTEPKRIRLKSNSYTTNNILDAVTAASIQVKEMGETNRPSDLTRSGSEQLADRKKGFTDWMKIMKPQNEEKDHWVPDEAVTKCNNCKCDFNAFVRRHHCRNCGDIFCDKCTQGRIALTADENAQQVRVCDQCMAEVTQRLSNAKEAAQRIGGLQSHEDLARKLKEEMSKNRKTTGKSSEGSGRMREVACPICTVHLQVQVPASGSETIECSVCQHPFLVSAH
ncbi:PREDICTED: protein FREE1-like [Ipomoea nil]|uniref:protein FREE1-like n=1 Tax=Ipomoea nil TaxID=35883 RepID=UPI00090145B0|nr:PREDICTED: protein FREE1-like [Ipomoea nil]